MSFFKEYLQPLAQLQPLVLGRLDISLRDISDPDMAMALHRLAHACKVPVQIKECCCEGKVVVHDLHEVTAADVLALAPLCTGCTHLTLYGGSLDPSLEFWRQLFDNKLERLSEGAASEAMCESLRLMAEQPWARWLDIKVSAAGRPLPACCLDMNKVSNNPPQPGRIKAVFGAQCQWLWLGHCTGAEHDGGAGSWQAVVSQQPPAASSRHSSGATAAQVGVGIDPDVTQAVSAASGVGYEKSGQLEADQLAWWKLTEVQANLKQITVTLATWDAVWEVNQDPKLI
ncbi:hypothetical protein HaLaN_05766, partial [Haematococcus lacustris]